MQNRGRESTTDVSGDLNSSTPGHIPSADPNSSAGRRPGTLVKPIARYSLAFRPAAGPTLGLRQVPAAARAPVCADGINYLDANTEYGDKEFHLPQHWVAQYYSGFLDKIASSSAKRRNTTHNLHPHKARRTLAMVRAICVWCLW